MGKGHLWGICHQTTFLWQNLKVSGRFFLNAVTEQCWATNLPPEGNMQPPKNAVCIPAKEWCKPLCWHIHVHFMCVFGMVLYLNGNLMEVGKKRCIEIGYPASFI